jgi:hypothetical protein
MHLTVSLAYQFILAKFGGLGQSGEMCYSIVVNFANYYWRREVRVHFACAFCFFVGRVGAGTITLGPTFGSFTLLESVSH